MRMLITGGTGFLGSNIRDYFNKIGVNATFADKHDADLTRFNEAYSLINNYDIVIHAAGIVGTGKFYNDNGASLYNLITQIDNNVIKACAIAGIKKLIYIGSGSAYSPSAVKNGLLKEEDFMSGEPDNYTLGYGYAKRNAYIFLRLCARQYGLKSVYLAMSTMYGKHQNATLLNGLFIPATITKFKEKMFPIVVHGTGKPTRDFLDAETAASIIYKFATEYECGENPELYNVGGSEGLSVIEVVKILAEFFHYSGEIQYDLSKPDGMVMRQLDNSKLYALFPELKPKRSASEIFKEKVKVLCS